MGKTLDIEKNKINKEKFDYEGDNHLMSSLESSLLDNAFDLSDDEKIAIIQEYFKNIMLTLGLDLNDDSLKGTPHRVAKMYVKEAFIGLKPQEKPKISLFDNKYQYGKMLVEKNISFHSCCEHHFLPIYGKVHIAYISSGKVIGLSKIPRIVDMFSRRLQVQERLTHQVADTVQETLEPTGVAVVMEGRHMCMQMRGVAKQNSFTTTSAMLGQFRKSNETRAEFLSFIGK